MLFKASIVCESCGEIHAERWLESQSRHASTTVLWMLCDICKEIELRDQMIDFAPEKICDCGRRHINDSDFCSPACETLFTF
jgi:hypothetical protein